MKSLMFVFLLSSNMLFSQNVKWIHEWEYDSTSEYNRYLRNFDDYIAKHNTYKMEILFSFNHIGFYDTTYLGMSTIYNVYTKRMENSIRFLMFTLDGDIVYNNGVNSLHKKNDYSYFNRSNFKSEIFKYLEFLSGAKKFYPNYGEPTKESYESFLKLDTVFTEITLQNGEKRKTGRGSEFIKKSIDSNYKKIRNINFIKYNNPESTQGFEGDMNTGMINYFYELTRYKDNSLIGFRSTRIVKHEPSYFDFDSLVNVHFDKVADNDMEFSKDMEKFLDSLNPNIEKKRLYLFSTLSCAPCDAIRREIMNNSKELEKAGAEVVIFKPYTGGKFEKNEKLADNVSVVYISDEVLDKMQIYYAPILIYKNGDFPLKLYDIYKVPNITNILTFIR